MNKFTKVSLYTLLVIAIAKGVAGLVADPIGELAGLGLYTLISVGFYLLLSTRKS